MDVCENCDKINCICVTRLTQRPSVIVNARDIQHAQSTSSDTTTNLEQQNSDTASDPTYQVAQQPPVDCSDTLGIVQTACEVNYTVSQDPNSGTARDSIYQVAPQPPVDSSDNISIVQTACQVNDTVPQR